MTFKDQKKLVDTVNDYALIEVICLGSAWVVSWVPFLSKIPVLIATITSMVFFIMRSEGTFELDEYFLDRDSYLTPEDYNISIKKMIYLYDTVIRNKYSNLTIGLFAEAFLLATTVL